MKTLFFTLITFCVFILSGCENGAESTVTEGDETSEKAPRIERINNDQAVFLHQAILQNNEQLQGYANHLLRSFEYQYNNDAISQGYMEKIREIDANTKLIANDIQTAIAEITNKAGGYERATKRVVNPDDRTIARDILLSKEPSAVSMVEIRKKLHELNKFYRKAIRDILKDEGAGGFDEYAYKEIESDLESFLKVYFLNSYSGNDIAWNQAMFDGVTVANALVVLEQIKGTVYQMEMKTLNFLFTKILKKVELNYNKFDVWTEVSSNSIKLGETYRAEILLGAYSSQTKHKVRVDDKKIITKDGRAVYETKPSLPGKKVYKVDVFVDNPLTGETTKYTKKIEYEVLPN